MCAFPVMRVFQVTRVGAEDQFLRAIFPEGMRFIFSQSAGEPSGTVADCAFSHYSSRRGDATDVKVIKELYFQRVYHQEGMGILGFSGNRPLAHADAQAHRMPSRFPIPL